MHVIQLLSGFIAPPVKLVVSVHLNFPGVEQVKEFIRDFFEAKVL
jgi:hypothetical protein